MGGVEPGQRGEESKCKCKAGSWAPRACRTAVLVWRQQKEEALSFEGSALANAWRCHQGLPHLGLLSVQQQSGEQRDSGRKKLAGECAFPGMTGGAPGSRHVRAVGNVSLAGF